VHKDCSWLARHRAYWSLWIALDDVDLDSGALFLKRRWVPLADGADQGLNAAGDAAGIGAKSVDAAASADDLPSADDFPSADALPSADAVAFDEEDYAPQLLERGEFALIACCRPHYSEGNRSARRRAAYMPQFVALTDEDWAREMASGWPWPLNVRLP
jgi:hypothetical protein